MPLTPGAAGYDPVRMAYKFTMMDGARTVDCEISSAALTDIAGGRCQKISIDRDAQFFAYRDKIERIWRLVEPGLSKKVTIVQDEDIKLLRRIVAGGGRKYTAGNVDRSKYDRLVDLGWLTPFKTNISDVEYQVTEKGRAASVDKRS
jgi:hypothetical protein